MMFSLVFFASLANAEVTFLDKSRNFMVTEDQSAYPGEAVRGRDMGITACFDALITTLLGLASPGKVVDKHIICINRLERIRTDNHSISAAGCMARHCQWLHPLVVYHHVSTP